MTNDMTETVEDTVRAHRVTCSALDANVAELLCDRHDPQATAFTFIAEDMSSHEFTYGQLAELSLCIAALFADRGVRARGLPMQYAVPPRCHAVGRVLERSRSRVGLRSHGTARHWAAHSRDTPLLRPGQDPDRSDLFIALADRCLPSVSAAEAAHTQGLTRRSYAGGADSADVAFAAREWTTSRRTTYGCRPGSTASCPSSIGTTSGGSRTTPLACDQGTR